MYIWQKKYTVDTMPGSGIVSELEVISSKSISNIGWIWSFGQLFDLAVPMSSLYSALIGKSTGNGGLGNYSKLIRSIFL